jgi:small subunit ribosomal protein S16
MSLVIRLTRTGKKGERKFRIVVKEKRSRRDGTAIDMLGWYEKDGKEGIKQLDMEKYNSWIAKGAQPSLTVSKIAGTK